MVDGFKYTLTKLTIFKTLCCKYYDVYNNKNKKIASKIKQESNKNMVINKYLFFAFPFSISVQIILLKKQKPKKIFLQ